MRIRLTVLALVAVSLAVGLAQERQAEDQLPRFRAGANLVRVDTYVSLNGTAVTDLKPEDVQVFEDDKPQRLESLELIEARGPASREPRSEPTTTLDMNQAAADAARLFTPGLGAAA